jgi:hypothetical protein
LGKDFKLVPVPELPDFKAKARRLIDEFLEMDTPFAEIQEASATDLSMLRVYINNRRHREELPVTIKQLDDKAFLVRI